MKTLIMSLVVAACPYVLFAQGSLKLSGKVVDGESGEPLTYASVNLKGKSVGTVTNSDGLFDFYVSPQVATDTLVIAMLGYASYESSVNDFSNAKNAVIRLKIKPIQLEEVVITDSKLTLKDIVSKAFNNIEINYQIQPYVSSYFFRETHQENTRCVILVEAVLDVYDKGYKAVNGSRSGVREKVNLKNVRASKNYRNTLFKNTVVERYNLVNSALHYNMLKYRNSHAPNAPNNYMLEGISNSNDNLVYVISFLSNIKRYPNFERKNTLYIDASTYAIYKYQWEEYAKEGKYSEASWRLTKDSTFFTRRKRIFTTYEYERYQGKMFLKYFDERCWDDIYNAKGDSVEFESLGHTTLLLTGLDTKTPKPEFKNLMKSEISLYSQITPYDPEFWHNFKQAVPLTKREVKDLEWEMPLEEQFTSPPPAPHLRPDSYRGFGGQARLRRGGPAPRPTPRYSGAGSPGRRGGTPEMKK